MKTLKLILMIAVMPSLIFLTTNCDFMDRDRPVEIDDILEPPEDFIECLNNCESERDQIDADYLACIDEPLSQWMSVVGDCMAEYDKDKDLDTLITCLVDAYQNHQVNIAECIRLWEEGKEEIKDCKKLCYPEHWGQ